MTLQEYLRTHPPQGFRPIPRYSRIGDMLEVYWDDGGPDFGYADPVNEQLTVIRAISDNRPIGVKIYGVAAMVQPAETGQGDLP